MATGINAPCVSSSVTTKSGIIGLMKLPGGLLGAGLPGWPPGGRLVRGVSKGALGIRSLTHDDEPNNVCTLLGVSADVEKSGSSINVVDASSLNVSSTSRSFTSGKKDGIALEP